MTNDSFQTAKHMLSEVYKDNRITFYCGAEYTEYGEIRLPEGFSTPKYENRATRMEWEHSVPAEVFGRNFPEWKHGGRKHTVKCGRSLLYFYVDQGENPFRPKICARRIPGWQFKLDPYSTEYDMSDARFLFMIS